MPTPRKVSGNYTGERKEHELKCVERKGNQTKNSLPVGEVSHTLMHKCSYKKLFYLPCLENLAK